ncbi:MAG: hypothetical protein D6805_06440 [Planctomycetota bacterium]|nr:MAG: hypothetical protein D6805_06440 [Planctomycetota bacterium]
MKSLVEIRQESENIYSLVLNPMQEREFRIDESFMYALLYALEELEKYPDVEGVLVYSDREDYFAEDGEFRCFLEVSEEELRRRLIFFRDVLRRLEGLDAPTVCLLRGRCGGMALELALVCRFRLAAKGEGSSFAFSQLQKGMLPYLGGGQRLVRLVGLKAALELLVEGRGFEAERGLELGLFDGLFSGPDLICEGVRWLRLCGKRREEGGKGSFLSRLLGGVEGYFLRKRYGSTPVASFLLRTMLEGIRYPLGKALEYELDMVLRFLGQEGVRNELRYAHLEDVHKRSQGIFFPPCSVGVVGAGRRGRQLAAHLAANGIPVRLKDINPQALGEALRYAHLQLRGEEGSTLEGGREGKPQLYLGKYPRLETLISPTLEYTGMRHCEVVVEAVMEEKAIKGKVLEELEKYCSPEAVWISLISSLSLGEVVGGCRHRQRIAGLQILYGVDTPLVELIRGEKTSLETLKFLQNFLKSLKKLPVVVKDSPGFLVNRVAFAYLNEALHLLEEGLLIEEIEEAMRGLGLERGPFEFMDHLGLDTLFYLSKNVATRLSHWPASSEIIEKVYKSGREGLKNGRGFYIYEKGQKRVDPRIYDLLREFRKDRKRMPSSLVANRLLLTMVQEAFLCQMEKVVENMVELELALTMGLALPRKWGGLFQYIKNLGIEKFLQTMDHSSPRGKLLPSKELRTFLENYEKVC